MDGRERKLFGERTQEVQFLRSENNFLRQDRDHYRKESFFTQQRINQVVEEKGSLLNMIRMSGHVSLFVNSSLPG